MAASGNISASESFFSERENLIEGAARSNPETNALLKGLSGDCLSQKMFQRNLESSDAVQELPLERLDFAFNGGLFPNVSAEIQEECLSAGWNSARKVFDIAIEQNVDFVLLTGDILQPDLTGIRGIVFLTEQFQRLKERGISAYWKLEHSLDRWKLPDFHFPENVFLFPASASHIKKFRLPDFSKDIFIVSQDSSAPDFSRYELSQLPNEKFPFFQTIALCPDEDTLERGIFRSEKETRRPQSVFEPLSREKETREFLAEKTESATSFPNSERGVEKLNVWDSVAESTSILEENSGNKSFSFTPSVTDSANTPFGEAAFVALTRLGKRLTRKKNWKTPEGEVFQTIVHASGPIQYRSPDIYDLNGGDPRPAGVTVVQQDLDGDVPISLQFFPTESISWHFLEKCVPGDVTSWDGLNRWMKKILIQEFSEKSVSEYSFKRNLDEQSATSSGKKIGDRKIQEKDVAKENLEKETAENQALAESDSNRNKALEQTSSSGFSETPRRILVFWKLSSEKAAQSELLRSLLAVGLEPEVSKELNKTQTLLEELREVGAELPSCPWSVGISVERQGLIPYSWGQADSMLGDFLRLTQFHLLNPDKENKSPDFASHSLNLDDMLEKEQLETLLHSMTKLTLSEETVLLELASVLGADALAKAQEGGWKK